MANRKFIADVPSMMEEWDFETNQLLDPETLGNASNKRASWICSKCGHRWEAKISNRCILGRGCPLCSNKVVVKGKNDLATTHPKLSKEWHPTKNGVLSAANITYGSGKKVWWVCPQGHSYQATILHRSSGTNCPICHSGRQTSFAEQATYFYVKQLYPDAISRYKARFLGRMELDIFIPSINYAIEYDGEAWHKENALKRERSKYKICQDNGIKLIRMREKPSDLGSMTADYQFSTEELYKPKNLERIIIEIIKRLNFSKGWLRACPIDVDLKRDRFEILKYRTDIRDRSLLTEFPDIAQEWHPSKNEGVTPAMFKPRSDHKVWWKCKSCGNDYQSAIGHRTSGTGCPKCAVEKVTSVKRKAVKMTDPETGEVVKTFVSISDAARAMGISSSNITMVCKGVRSKAGGYCWSYK